MDKTVLNRCDIMPNYEKYLNYFEDAYKIEIQDKNQKLIQVYTDEIIAHWVPIYKSIEDIKVIASKYSIDYTIEEMCKLHPFSSNFFFKATVLPIALYRLNSLLQANELKKIIESQFVVHLHEKLNWGFYDLARNDKIFKEFLTTCGLKNTVSQFKMQDIEKQGKKITDFTKSAELQYITGPPPTIILEALTCKGNCDEFNNSHLKFIGNIFLKYIVTVSIFFTNSSADEGKMTNIKSNRLQNSVISKSSERINLTKFLIRKGFDEWLPPCFIRNATVDQTAVSIKRKSDTIKALVGAYLISCGFKCALLFAHSMQLEFLKKEKKKSTEELINEWPSSFSYIPRVIPHEVLKISVDFQNIETVMHYKFKNRNLLIEAMLHKSYKNKKKDISYERLEYLGDGILDYVIARQLFEMGIERSVDWCNDSFVAITNNEFLGYLALKMGLYKFIIMGQEAEKKMRCQVEKMEKRHSFIYFKVSDIV